jgi:hypothetical protein
MPTRFSLRIEASRPQTAAGIVLEGCPEDRFQYELGGGLDRLKCRRFRLLARCGFDRAAYRRPGPPAQNAARQRILIDKSGLADNPFAQ